MKFVLTKIKKASFLLPVLAFLILCNGCKKRELPPLPSAKIEVPEGNPFAIAAPDKKDLTQEDYITLQQELRKIDVSSYLEKLYPKDQEFAEFSDFLARSSRGITQTIIDVEKGLLPEQQLIKIGKGGDRCVVTRASYAHVYTSFLPRIQKALEDAGFNGYFLYQKGGVPNPTGKEIQYAGVPYSFKIFTMMEAYRLGFTNVLWIDSAIIPLSDLSFCFNRIEKIRFIFLL